jgi:uncharacterized protein (DUF302 family)
MKILLYTLAALGLLFLVLLMYFIIKFEPAYHTLKRFDENAIATYSKMISTLVETGNAADATVWKVKVDKGLTAEDVEDAMKSIAAEHNIKNVGELPLYQQITAMTGKNFRYMKIYMYCNPLTAAKMIDYSDAFSAYLPCRITLLEDKQGQLWLYSLNMDMMIYGGTPLPPELKKEAIRVKTIIQDIMNRGASGEF